MKIIGVIPARKGSKRLPNKNKLDFYGKPLVCWTIMEALKVDWFHEIILSTNDQDIIDICRDYTEDKRFKIHKRSEEFAQDDTTMGETARELFDKRRNEDIIIVLLHPTSPLRRKEHIIEAIEQYLERRIYGKMVSIYQKDIMKWWGNGAIYITELWNILEGEEFYEDITDFYIMDEESSVDINTQEEFNETEKIMKRRLGLKL